MDKPQTTRASTPLPWKRKGKGLFDFEGSKIAQIQFFNCDSAEQEANMDLIVEAVNAIKT